MPTESTTHLVLIPSYNPGAKVYDTVRAARAHWSPVWVVVDALIAGTFSQASVTLHLYEALQALIHAQQVRQGGWAVTGP